jgi:hypothetical protein
MLWLLDRATQLTNLKKETPCPALAATLLFAHGQTTERTVTAAERLGRALGVTVKVLPYWGARASMKSGMDVLCTAAPFKITSRRRLIPYQRVACPRDLGVLP